MHIVDKIWGFQYQKVRVKTRVVADYFDTIDINDVEKTYEAQMLLLVYSKQEDNWKPDARVTVSLYQHEEHSHNVHGLLVKHPVQEIILRSGQRAECHISFRESNTYAQSWHFGLGYPKFRSDPYLFLKFYNWFSDFGYPRLGFIQDGT